MKVILALVVTITITPLVVIAQGSADDGDEPMFGRLVERFKSDPLSIGVVTQVVADAILENEGSGSGFSLATARMYVRGKLDHGFSYFLQADMAKTTTPVINASVGYTPIPEFTIEAGVLKTPFSAEFLIPAPSIDFVNRSQVVSRLAPGRQVGVTVRGRFDGGLRYRGGVYNGNGITVSGNDNDQFMYVGRLSFVRPLKGGEFEIGGNAAYSEDNFAGMRGRRTLFGGDTRITVRRLLLSGEAIYGEIDPVNGATTQPFGFQATAGVMIVPGRHQILARFDSLDRDTGADSSDFVVLGWNFWPSTPFGLQVNYLLPINDGVHEVLVNFQVAI